MGNTSPDGRGILFLLASICAINPEAVTKKDTADSGNNASKRAERIIVR